MHSHVVLKHAWARVCVTVYGVSGAPWLHPVFFLVFFFLTLTNGP